MSRYRAHLTEFGWKQQKTELIRFELKAKLAKMSSANLSISVGNERMNSSRFVHDLGVMFLSIRHHNCFVARSRVYQIQRLSRLVGKDVAVSTAPFSPGSQHPPPRWCSGLKTPLLNLFCSLHPYGRGPLALIWLHWLPIRFRINCKSKFALWNSSITASFKFGRKIVEGLNRAGSRGSSFAKSRRRAPGNVRNGNQQVRGVYAGARPLIAECSNRQS